MISKLGPYRLEKLLGRGGMGSVYVGVHEETGERAAIKALSFTLAEDESFRSRFMVEVATLKQLRHPNIVRLVGDGEQDGQLFYVMELVEGKSLQDLLQSEYRFSWQEVIRIAIDICSALKHAHDCGVIHRDIKPANLLRSSSGALKLTDFGIAKLFGATHHTAAGSVVGTADFMSPEQSDGRQVTTRTDLYSLGAVMFTLLARRAPFQGGSLAQVVHRLKYEDAPSVRRYAPHVPAPLDEIIGELLRKDPQQRVATALVLANRLRAMEHVLVARGLNELPPDAVTHVGEPLPELGSAPPDQPVQRRRNTQISQTVADQANPRAGQVFPWNDATLQGPAQAPAAQTPLTGASDSRAEILSPPEPPQEDLVPGGPQPAGVSSPAPEEPPTDPKLLGSPSPIPGKAKVSERATSPSEKDAMAQPPKPHDASVTQSANRFTTVDDEPHSAAGRHGAPVQATSAAWLTIFGTAGLLAGVVALCVWGMWPPSADELYGKIQSAAMRGATADARNHIDQFLARFPHDPRSQEVDGLRMDVECDWLATRLRLRKRKTDGLGVEGFEQQWLEAYLLRKDNPLIARQKFLSILESHGAVEASSEALDTVLAATRHQLRRLDTAESNP